MAWTFLILFTIIVAIAIFGSIEFIAGVVIGVLLAPYLSKLCADGSPEQFLGREIMGVDVYPSDECRIEAKGPPIEMPYAPQWGSMPGYNECYNPVAREFSCDPNAAMGIDQKNMALAQLRARDKKCMDGAVSKNMYFYKKNYYNELDKEEAKQWWGRNEE